MSGNAEKSLFRTVSHRFARSQSMLFVPLFHLRAARHDFVSEKARPSDEIAGFLLPVSPHLSFAFAFAHFHRSLPSIACLGWKRKNTQAWPVVFLLKTDAGTMRRSSNWCCLQLHSTSDVQTQDSTYPATPPGPTSRSDAEVGGDRLTGCRAPVRRIFHLCESSRRGQPVGHRSPSRSDHQHQLCGRMSKRRLEATQ